MGKYPDILSIVLKEHIKNYDEKYVFNIKENIFKYIISCVFMEV